MPHHPHGGYWAGMPRRARRQLWLELVFWIVVAGLWAAGSLWWFALVALRVGWALLMLFLTVEANATPGDLLGREPGFIRYSYDYAHDRSPVLRVAIQVTFVALLAYAGYETFEDYIPPDTVAEEAGALERAWDWARDKTGL